MIISGTIVSCAALWLLLARANYRFMVRHDWLRAVSYRKPAGNGYLDYTRCPDFRKTSHPSGGYCAVCGTAVPDWKGTRRDRALAALATGPFLLPLILVAWVLTAGQPVQKEEQDYRLEQAEAELARANKKLNDIKNGLG